MTTCKLKNNIKRLMLFVATILCHGAITANTYDNITDEGVHRIGNYNIRYYNTSDTGDEAWSARGGNVISLIDALDLDVIGLVEVTAGKQLEDLYTYFKETRSDYSYIYAERDGKDDANGYSYNLLAFRNTKYTLKESGHFWLSSTPDVVSSGWEYATNGTDNDANAAIKRTCVWMKLEVKSGSDAGKPLLVAMAHTNAGKLLDGPESGKLISARLSQYANEMADAYGMEHGTVPVVLVGDFNMDRRRGLNQHAYREYMTYFTDAALSADLKKTTPYTNSDSGINQYTTTGFTPMTSATDGSIFDYVFYRNVHATGHYIITENYGKTVNPSDHYPVYITCKLGHNVPNLYVNANAAAGGDGSITAPFNTITAARNIATAGTTIHVTADTYAESFELKAPIQFIGGYDSRFENIVGKTTLDGTGKTNIIKAKRNSVYFSNFRFANASSTDNSEGGAIYSTGAEVVLDNVEFSDNKVATTSTNIYYGAALNTVARDVRLTDCYFHGNSAPSGSAIHMAYLNNSNVVWGTETARITGCTFVDNSSVEISGVSTRGAVSITGGAIADHFSFWNNTFANNCFNGSSGGGTAIYAYCVNSATRVNFSFNTVVGNYSTVQGVATFFTGGQLSLTNNIIAGNFNARTDQTLDEIQHDLYSDDNKTTIVAKQYNLRTTAKSFRTAAQSETDFYAVSTNDNITSYVRGIAALEELIDGAVINGKFYAELADNGGNTPTVKVNSKLFDGKQIDKLSATLRNLEATFGIDINYDGDTSDYMNVDQRGSTRLTNSVPGACEFVPLPLFSYFIIPGSEGRGTGSGYSWETAACEADLPMLMANAKPGSTFYLQAGVYSLYKHYNIPEAIVIKGGYPTTMTGRNIGISYEGTLSPDYAEASKTIFDAQGNDDGIPFFIIGNPNVKSGQYPDYYGGAINTSTKTDYDRVRISGVTIRNASNTTTTIDYPGSAMLVTHAIICLDHVIFEDNSLASVSATRPRGGVVMARGSYVYATDCAWRGNHSASNGVALNIRQRESKGDENESDRSVVILDRCEFTDNMVYNSSATYGGTLVLGDYGGTLYMNNCTATGTTISSNGAFARIGTSAKFISVNNTFYKCTATGDLKGIVSCGGNSTVYIANTIAVNPSYGSGDNNAAMYYQNTFTSGGYNVWGPVYSKTAGTTTETDSFDATNTTQTVFGSSSKVVDGGNGLQVIAPLSQYKKMTLKELRELVVEWNLPDEFDVTRDSRGYYRGAVTYAGAYDPDATETRAVDEYFVAVDGTGDGSSWESALSPNRFFYLLQNAPVGDKYHIKEGTYLPKITSSGSRTSVTYSPWNIPQGVFIQGGYPESYTGTNTSVEPTSTCYTIFTADYDGDGVGDNGDLPFVWFNNSGGSKDSYAKTTINNITFSDAFSTCEARKYYNPPIFIENANVEFGWCRFLNNVTGYLIKHESDYYQLSPKEGYESKGSSFALPATYTTPVYEVVGAGGAVTLRGSKVYIHDCIFRNNETTHGGAALCIRQSGGTTSSAVSDRSFVKVERSEFTDNILPVQGVTEKDPELDTAGQLTGYYKYHELAQYGGCISLADYGGELYMINSTISGSHVRHAGGAIRIGTGGVFKAESCTFFDCTASTSGGLLSLGGSTDVHLCNNIAVNETNNWTSGRNNVNVHIQSNSSLVSGGYNILGSVYNESQSTFASTDDIDADNVMSRVFVNENSDTLLEDETKNPTAVGHRHFDNERYPGYDYFAIGHNEEATYSRELGIDHVGTYVMTPSRVYYDKYDNTGYGAKIIAARETWNEKVPSVRHGEMNVYVDQRNYYRKSSTIAGAYDPYATLVSTETSDVRYSQPTLSVTALGGGYYTLSGVSGECSVYDVSGVQVVSVGIDEGDVLDLSRFGAGIYIVRVNNQTAKIIKK